MGDDSPVHKDKGGYYDKIIDFTLTNLNLDDLVL